MYARAYKIMASRELLERWAKEQAEADYEAGLIAEVRRQREEQEAAEKAARLAERQRIGSERAAATLAEVWPEQEALVARERARREREGTLGVLRLLSGPPRPWLEASLAHVERVRERQAAWERENRYHVTKHGHVVACFPSEAEALTYAFDHYAPRGWPGSHEPHWAVVDTKAGTVTPYEPPPEETVEEPEDWY